MVLEKEVQIDITVRNVTYYRNKGYDCKQGDNITVKIEDLNINSRLVKIHAQCDICSGITILNYQKYNINYNREGWNFYSCNDCSGIKYKMTSQKKYSVDNPVVLEWVQLKIEETKLKKYGNKHYNNFEKTKETKLFRYDNAFYNNPEKFKETMLKNWGVEYAMQSPILVEKFNNNIMIKYNVDNISKIDGVQDKIKQTKLLKYDDENYNNPEKAKLTSIELYGKPHYTQTLEFLEKSVIMNQKNWGVDWPIQSPIVREKSKQTLLLKFGVDHYAKTPEFLINLKIILFERYGNENYNNHEKIKLTKLIKYGDENYNNMEKAMETKEERYGDPFYSDKEKSKQTKILNGNQIPDDLLTNFQKYKKIVRNLSRQKFIELFKMWDGLDFYDKEYIGDYSEKQINHIHPNYPNVDHIIPVIYGFIHNIPAEEIAAIDNLCITKRINNLRKGKKLVDVFNTTIQTLSTT